MVSTIRIGPEGGPYVKVEENNGTLDITTPNDTVDLQSNELVNAALGGIMNANGNDITNVNQLDANSVNTNELYTRGSWTDVTNDRSQETAYTANNGVREVSIKFNFDTTNRTGARLLDANTSIVIDDITQDTPDTSDIWTLQATIPGGDSYEIRASGDTITVVEWHETM